MLWPKLILAGFTLRTQRLRQRPNPRRSPVATTSGPQGPDSHLGTRGSCSVRLHPYFGTKRP